MNKFLSIPVLAMLTILFMSNSSTSIYDMRGGAESSQRFDFMYSGAVSFGPGTMPLVGQLSKDGQKLFFTSQSHQGDRALHVSKRAENGVDFIKSEKVAGLDDRQILMPSISADEQKMVFVESHDGTQSGNDLYVASMNDNKVSDIQKIETLSEAGVSENYPFLSADGSRLYYTKQNGPDIEFYVASANAEGQFGEAEKMNIDIPKTSNNMSCILSNDELDIYVLSGDHIYHAQRASLEGNFSAPEKIASSHTEGYMTGIAMTNDTEELLVFNSVGFRNTQVLKFINTKAKETQAGPNVQFVDVE